MLAAAAGACVATVVTACVTVCAGCATSVATKGMIACAIAAAAAFICGVGLSIVLLSEEPPHARTHRRPAHTVHCTVHTQDIHACVRPHAGGTSTTIYHGHLYTQGISPGGIAISPAISPF